MTISIDEIKVPVFDKLQYCFMMKTHNNLYLNGGYLKKAKTILYKKAKTIEYIINFVLNGVKHFCSKFSYEE